MKNSNKNLLLLKDSHQQKEQTKNKFMAQHRYKERYADEIYCGEVKVHITLN